MPGGRPTKYTKELAEEICDRIAGGESLRRICLDDHIPHKQTVINWALDLNHEFFGQYARARLMQYEGLADEVLDVADDGSNDYMQKEIEEGITVEVYNSEHVQRSRLRVDTRKWFLSKVLPKFKEGLDITSGGQPIQKELDYSKLDEETLRKLEEATSDNEKGS